MLFFILNPHRITLSGRSGSGHLQVLINVIPLEGIYSDAFDYLEKIFFMLKGI
jgi:hypothetical protein